MREQADLTTEELVGKFALAFGKIEAAVLALMAFLSGKRVEDLTDKERRRPLDQKLQCLERLLEDPGRNATHDQLRGLLPRVDAIKTDRNDLFHKWPQIEGDEVVIYRMTGSGYVLSEHRRITDEELWELVREVDTIEGELRGRADALGIMQLSRPATGFISTSIQAFSTLPPYTTVAHKRAR